MTCDPNTERLISVNCDTVKKATSRRSVYSEQCRPLSRSTVSGPPCSSVLWSQSSSLPWLTAHRTDHSRQVCNLLLISWVWGCSSVGRASNRHAADAGSILRCGKGIFLPESTSSADSPRCVCTPPCATAYINISAQVEDPVVHVRVCRIMETPQHSAHAP